MAPDKTDKTDLEAYTLRGDIYFSALPSDDLVCNHRRALEDYTKALKLSMRVPNSEKKRARLYLAIAGIYFIGGYGVSEDYQKALENYKKALSFTSSPLSADLRAIAYLNMADIYRFFGDRANALLYYRRSLKTHGLSPKDEREAKRSIDAIKPPKQIPLPQTAAVEAAHEDEKNDLQQAAPSRLAKRSQREDETLDDDIVTKSARDTAYETHQAGNISPSLHLFYEDDECEIAKNKEAMSLMQAAQYYRAKYQIANAIDRYRSAIATGCLPEIYQWEASSYIKDNTERDKNFLPLPAMPLTDWTVKD